jgi:hypothetical protein
MHALAAGRDGRPAQDGVAMSNIKPSTNTPTATTTMDMVRRWTPVVVSVLAFLYAAVEVFSLAIRHNDGARISGVIVAAIATLAGVLSVFLTVSNKRQAILAQWPRYSAVTNASSSTGLPEPKTSIFTMCVPTVAQLCAHTTTWLAAVAE